MILTQTQTITIMFLDQLPCPNTANLDDGGRWNIVDNTYNRNT